MKNIKKSLSNKRVAIVCDWIWDWGGAEIVLEQLMETFPTADIFSSVFWQQDNPVFAWRNIITSGIQKIPLLNKKHKLASILRPQAFESFDLSSYDIVISSSSAESKWVITKPDCLHICYCHTPTRYFWSHYHEYKSMMEFGILNPLASWLMPKLIHSLRSWDYVAAQRPDLFIANSKNTHSRISIPYKKFDLIVNAFNKNWLPLKIAANTDNKLARALQKQSKSNIEWIFETDNTKINALHSKAKAFLFPPEEDFGLVPIAAMATGTPVIAYGKWGALETVVAPNPPTGTFPPREKESSFTGIFFEEQTPESLNSAIEKFENTKFDAKKIRAHALKFDKKVFQKNITQYIKKNLV